MYFKLVSRGNPATAKIDSYYRIVESYRNINDRVCHRTLLNIGFIEYDKDLLPNIQAILNDKQKNALTLFKEKNIEAIAIANQYWNQMVEKGKVDADPKKLDRKVDIDTIKHKNVREVGTEWLCYQAAEQLGIGNKLSTLGWSEEKVQLALTQIVSRAVYPF